MTCFVKAPYVMAAFMREKLKKKQNTATINELGAYGINVQRRANSEGVDAVFLATKRQCRSAAANFSNYFVLYGEDCVGLARFTDGSDLEALMAAVPEDIEKVMQEESAAMA